MFVKQEIEEKKTRVHALMQKLALDALYIKRQSNFSWLTGGGQNVVGITLELGVAGLLITKNRDYAICNNIEAPRMALEENLEARGYQIQSFPWYEDNETELVHKLSGSICLGSDHVFPNAKNIASQIAPLRYSLTPWEVERYREVGDLSSLAIEETAREVRPGDRECEVVGRLAGRLWKNRLDIITTFCAADERIANFRHPIPTEKRIKDRVMLCVNSRKYGLIVSLTRFVQFGKLPPEFRKKYDANVEIDCTFMANTIPGKSAGEVFTKGIDAYKKTGYADEYKLHHQGGAIGYTGRDYKANFATKEVIQENQAFAWNPSITGCKSEDTMLATSSGPVLLTQPKIYPALKLEVCGKTFARPDILVL
jgi:Xaa-Pro aminopeptidase